MTEVILDIDDGVAVMTLNAPERRNAMNAAMAGELIEAMTAVNENPDVGATVIRGAGGHLCAGADRSVLTAAGQDPTEPETFAGIGSVYDTFAKLDIMATPTIAAVRGYSVGAGVNLAMAADVRIMAKDAVLRSGFFGIGLHPGGGHFTLLGREANRSTATAMAAFGCDLKGERAVQMGLAWEALDDAAVEGRCLDMAHYAARDPELARLAVPSLRGETGGGHYDVAAASRMERAAQMWTFRRKAIRG
jgi:enoyl-CoA hydratase